MCTVCSYSSVAMFVVMLQVCGTCILRMHVSCGEIFVDVIEFE